MAASIPQPISEETRKNILENRIAKYLPRGYFIVSQTDHNAQLKRPKKFSCLWAALWFLFFGIGIIVYLIYYAAKRDDLIYIEVDPYGTVKDNGPSYWRNLLVAALVFLIVICLLIVWSIASSPNSLALVLSSGAYVFLIF